MQDRLATFADVLHPFPEDRFFDEVHDKRPLHIRAETASKFATVMSWPILNRILNMTAIWSPESLQLVLDRETIPAEAYCREAVDRTNTETLRPDAEKVKLFLRRGASLIANDIDTLTPQLAAAADIFERTLGGKVQSNLYYSSRQRQAFDTHFDTHEVFALHIEGEKKWRIYEGRVDRPIAHPAYRRLDKAYHDAHKGPVKMDATMRPGDLLYIPRGYYHDALASSPGTIHISFGVTHVIGYDLLNILLAHAVADPAFRTNFPLSRTGEAASRRYMAELVKHVARLAGSDPVLADMQRFRHEYGYPRGGIDLPADAEPSAYQVTGQDLRLVERNGQHMIENQAGALVIPATFVPIVEWILAQHRFEAADLARAFPHSTTEQTHQILANMAKTGVIQPA